MSAGAPGTPAPGGSSPPAGEHRRGSSESLLGLAVGALGAIAVLPVLVVGCIAALLLRRSRPRVLAGVVVATGAAAAVSVGLTPGWPTIETRYEAPYRAILASIGPHTPPLHLSAGVMAGTLWLALPAGVLAAGAWELRRRVGAKRAVKLQSLETPLRGEPSDARLAALRLRRADREAEQRVVLGTTASGRILATERSAHTAVVAPTRSGKTRGIVLPAILAWRGPVIATSSKADILFDLEHGSGALAWRARQGPVFIFDPSGASGYPSVRWSPLGRARTWPGALRAAFAVVSAAGAGEHADSTARFFSARAASVLSPALHAVALHGGGMAELGRIVRGASDLAALADVLEQALRAGGACPEAVHAVAALRSGSESSSGDVLATLNNILAPFVDNPKVAASTECCELSPEALIEAGGTLFVVSGPDSQRLAPLYSCLLDEIFAWISEHTMRSGPLDPRLLCALDEVANIAPIAELASLLSTVAGMGVTILSSWQSLSQMQGLGGASQILGNSTSKVFAPSSDPETLEYLGRALGSRLLWSQSLSSNVERGLLGAKRTADAHSVSTSLVERRLFSAEDFNCASGPLLLHPGLDPIELGWRWHDTTRKLRARSKLPLPEPGLVDPDVPEEPADDEPLTGVAGTAGRVAPAAAEIWALRDPYATGPAPVVRAVATPPGPGDPQLADDLEE